MQKNHNILFLFGFSWLLMLMLDFYFAWFSMPDLILSVAATSFFYGARYHFWRYLLPISLLADTSASTPLFFHAFFYACSLLFMYAFHRTWREISTAGCLFLILVVSIVLQFARCLLLYLFTGISAPQSWYWAIPIQFLLWIFFHTFVLNFLSPKDE